ncbi:UNVERIFIED_CONTAM: hypothetical protein FKN15_014885 [Acipenser sinensis]
MWTSINMESYLALASHYISPEGNLVTKLLAVHRFTERHTSDTIATCLYGIIQSWGLRGKVQCAVTDNGANMVAAIRKLNLRHMLCFAHTLHLIVKDSLAAVADLEEIREKIKKIVGYFRTSTVTQEKLAALQCDMKQQILKPFFVVTEEMLAEKHVTASKVIILVRNLQRITATAAQQNLPGTTANNLADALNKSIWKRCQESRRNMDEAIKALSTEASQPTEAGSSQTVATGAGSTEPDDVWKEFDAKVTQQNPNKDFATELKMYPRSLLQFWNSEGVRFPHLMKLAWKYLCMPATSVPSERVFSRLKAKENNMTLFLYCKM